MMWDDNKIFGKLKELGAYDGDTIPVEVAEMLGFIMRDEYEQSTLALATQVQRIAQLEERVRELEEELGTLKRHASKWGY